MCIRDSYDPARLDRAVRESALQPSAESVTITPAALGADLLMVGAAGLAFGPVLANPSSLST